MSMSQSLLKRSFQPILPIADDFVDHFYGELFSAHPELRSLFSVEQFSKQKENLPVALAFVIENIQDSERVGSYLREMGKASVARGAKPEHLDWVGQAFLGSLRYFYSDNWTHELQVAWSAAVQFISDGLTQGMLEQVALHQNSDQGTNRTELEAAVSPASAQHEEVASIQAAAPVPAPADLIQSSPRESEPLRARVDQLASEVLINSMKRQAEDIAVQVVANLKETFLTHLVAQIVQEEIKKQAAFCVTDILKAAVEAEAKRLIPESGEDRATFTGRSSYANQIA